MLVVCSLTLVWSFNRCWAEVIAPSTDCLLTRDLMLDAVPYSLASIDWVWATCVARVPGSLR